MGILLGGIIPIFVLGVAIFLLKLSSAEKISISYHLLFSAIGLLISCVLSFFIFSDRDVTIKGATCSLSYGIGLGIGLILIAISLTKYNTPMSVISPIFKEQNTNGTFRNVVVHAKKARGALVRYALTNNSKNPQDLIQFNKMGWKAAQKPPESGTWLFTRPAFS